MNARQTPAGDWVERLIRDYQDAITGGLYRAIYRLDGRALRHLMDGQAAACMSAFLKLTDLPAPLELDRFLEAMRTAGPSPIDIQREGDIILWTERHRGECVCPLVRRKVIDLHPKLCLCGASWVRQLFRVAAGTEVEVETLETVATGAQNCRFRIRIRGPTAEGFRRRRSCGGRPPRGSPGSS